MTRKELFSALYKLRENLKRKFYQYGHITPTICSDSALNELAAEAPKHKEDLYHINGLGQTFVDKYGDYFMEVLNQYHSSNVSTKTLNTQVKQTLKNLENRLVNISKRNRLLYLGKIYNKYAFDMFANSSFNDDVVNLLIGKKTSLKLCDTNSTQAEKERRYKRLLQLLREITRDFKENGQYDLYVGYPYVVGRTKGENFDVRAPLVLFPITFDREDNEITIKIDKTKDILFNNNLVLLQYKFLSKNNELPNNTFENFTKDSFLEQIISYYSTAGIELIDDGDIEDLSRFNDIKYGEFPTYKNGEFHIVSNAVLGKFSLYSSALQRDFKSMIDDSEISDLLDELLSGMEDIDFYSDEVAFNDKEIDDEKPMEFSERNLNYINELNSSQEQAILSIDKNDKLVIQGPPGTGKSQTITSLIADVINKGHNVLMVSQKKAALDVIYSRLGNLSKFAIMLSDVKNKESFYKQLYNLFLNNRQLSNSGSELYSISLNIDEQIKNLEKIAEKLYTTKTNGTEMYKIYLENTKNLFKNNQNISKLFYNTVPQELTNLDYQKLIKIKDRFSNQDTLNEIINYYMIISNVPFINDVNNNLNDFDVSNMQNDIEIYIEEQTDYLKKNFFVKLFNYKKRKKATNILFDKYFLNQSSKNEIYKNPKILENIPNYYYLFQSSKAIFQSLDNDEIVYSKTMYNLYKSNNQIDLNLYLFDFIVHCIIQNFEHKNTEILSEINNFDSVIKQITKLMQKKKELTKEKFKDTLIKAFFNEIARSKRYNEICRQIESSKKASVQRFIKKFGFELFKGIKIWLMTPESVSEVLPLEKGLFDVLIFDEASQIYIEKGIPAISRANKVVIAGDHKQLRPSSLGFGRFDTEEDDENEDIEDNAALEEESLLDLARFKYPSVLLNYHYRSKYEELINFSNYAFYDGRLNVSPNTDEPETPPIEIVKIDNGRWIDRCNKQEALKVVELIKDFLIHRKHNESLGVITFNSNQRDMIMDELDKECSIDKEFAIICKKEFDRTENGEDIGLFIKNIENVQGDERDCIIFSLAYAKNESGRVVRNFGWLNQKGGENRLNVAISRAKQKIYIITSITPNELFVDDLKNEGPKIFKKYLEYAYAISNRDKELAKQILYSFADEKKGINDDVTFDSDFENQVYDKLIEKGLIVDTQVGVGGYRIDLAIKDKESQKYLLGIECDGKLYHSSLTARERDIYRQKYLESRGWKIYRIWSTNWWHNPDKEINNILKVYNSLK